MAVRPVFIPVLEGPVFVRTEMVEFPWSPGLALSQQQKCVAALHQEATETLGLGPILEVSRKSPQALGVALSAFNLLFDHPETGDKVSVECAFQAAKVFLRGGPYRDLLGVPPREAKRDPRLRDSGPLTAFRFAGQDWPIEPQTAFYDWLYIRALLGHEALAAPVLAHAAFTDIAFNPLRSINCQAYALALCVSLERRGLVIEAVRSQETFLACLKPAPVHNARQDDTRQGSLF